MNPATINSTTFSLTGPGTTPVSGLVAYAAMGDTLTFTPTANLAPSTPYTATITTGAQNLAGTALASNYIWTFTTGAAVVVIPPEMVSTVPANAATNVPLNQAVSATFSEAMNPLTITTATFQLTGPGGTAVVGTVSYDAVNFIATFTPTAPLTRQHDLYRNDYQRSNGSGRQSAGEHWRSESLDLHDRYGSRFHRPSSLGRPYRCLAALAAAPG